MRSGSTSCLPVSVIMPTRNRAHVLERAIDSVLDQSFSDFELLIINDGSTDATASILDSYVRRDPRVRWVHLADAHKGASAARNAGIAAAHGTYVAFIDDDAVWLRHKLQAQFDALAGAGDAHPVAGVDVVYCAFARIAADGRQRVIGSSSAAEGDPWRILLSRTFIDTSCLLVRATTLRSIGGFDENLPRLQDWDLALRLARTSRFAFVPGVLVHSYDSPGSISSRPDALVMACRRLVQKVEAVGATPSELATIHRSLGHALMVGGAPDEGRRLLTRALRLCPGSIIGAFMLLLAVLGGRIYRCVNAVRIAFANREIDVP